MIHGELRVVQFLHPGGEHRPDANGFKEWNPQTRLHRRKFLELPGRAIADLDAKREFEGDLHFWAEWEPESELLRRFDPAVTDGPRFLFRPFLRRRRSYAGLQNTDPFVFGDRFYYCICQQRGAMQRLDRGSVILFGSNRGGQFVLDTVFVVANWRWHTSANLRHLPVSSVYRQVALEPLYDAGPCGGRETAVPLSKSYRLYEGVMHNAPVDGMFSFFPCVPAERSNGFSRPHISLPGIVNPSLKQGRKMIAYWDVGAVRSAWRSVAQQVESQHRWLGVFAQLPQLC